MPERPSFIPGHQAPSEPPLASYRPQQPVGVAEGYVRSLTAPAELVVDLFCQGPRFVEESVRVGRRVVAFNVNPVLLHAARSHLTPPDPHALDVGFTQVADSRKGDRPLRSHLISLYRSRCPSCWTEGTAEWFAWRRDLDRPFQKGVRCAKCGGLQVGATNEEDIAAARSVAPRGLSYYYALDRAAPLGHPARERAAELVDCYTPRNLSALMDLCRHVEGVKADADVRAALTSLLLDCFDQCSRLYPYGEDRPRPRTLRIPARYLERNVWFCFEEGLSRLERGPSVSVSPEIDDVNELIQLARPGYGLVASAARDVGQILPANSVDLVLLDPPTPDGVFWALSAMWAAWLWSSTEVRALRPFLRRRRFDWRWHWQALREALRAVGPRLTDDGHLVTLFGAGHRAMLTSVCLAAAGAGYRLQGWGHAPDVGYRLVWTWKDTSVRRTPLTEATEKRVVAEVKHAVTRALRRRGEPSSESLLHAAAYAHLSQCDLLEAVAHPPQDVHPMDTVAGQVDRAFRAASIRKLGEAERQDGDYWWLLQPGEPVVPLADRVEELVRELLIGRLVWRESELVEAVYSRLPGILTPELVLVRTCVTSYGNREGQQIRLRSEDDVECRRIEVDSVREDLASLGSRLGFRTSDDGAWDVRWLDREREAYVFKISVTAELAAYLLRPNAADLEAQRCLVVPGGRAELIDLKLRRDPRLERAVGSGAWQFIKFRHLRRLVAEEDLDRRAFGTVLGLDPIAEREHAQLPLF